MLRVDGAAAALLEAFNAAGIQALLLKGATFAQWLYPDGKRFYIDCDVLVSPADFAAAEQTLGALGCRRTFDERSMPSWWREHASAWVRERDGVTIDLHRTLPGVGADPETAWQVLAGGQATVVVAGRTVPALGLAGRAFHVALHAAHHGADWARPIDDLDRALATGDERLWRCAAALAGELDAVDPFAAGLRLTPMGRQLADRLELPRIRSVQAALHASTAPPIALGFEQLARAPGMRARLEIAWHKVVPPPAFIRHWDPRANDSRSALVCAYLRRPLWLLRHAPRGFSAWRAAQRSARNERQ